MLVSKIGGICCHKIVSHVYRLIILHSHVGCLIWISWKGRNKWACWRCRMWTSAWEFTLALNPAFHLLVAVLRTLPITWFRRILSLVFLVFHHDWFERCSGHIFFGNPTDSNFDIAAAASSGSFGGSRDFVVVGLNFDWLASRVIGELKTKHDDLFVVVNKVHCAIACFWFLSFWFCVHIFALVLILWDRLFGPSRVLKQLQNCIEFPNKP